MIVARCSGPTLALRAAAAPSFSASQAAPCCSSSERVTTRSSSGVSPSRRIAWRKAGSWSHTDCSFVSCSAFSTKIATLPEFSRMYTQSSGLLDG